MDSTTQISEAEDARIARTTLLRPKRTAQLLDVTEPTLAVWRSTKRYPLKFVRVGRAIRYRLSDVEEFLRLRTESGDGASTAYHRRRARAH